MIAIHNQLSFLSIKTGQKFAMLELKVLLSTFLRKYHVTSLQKLSDMDIVAESVLNPPHGIKIKIKRRTWYIISSVCTFIIKISFRILVLFIIKIAANISCNLGPAIFLALTGFSNFFLSTKNIVHWSTFKFLTDLIVPAYVEFTKGEGHNILGKKKN